MPHPIPCRTTLAAALVSALLGPALAAAAPTPAVKCESAKNVAAANDAKCLASIYRKSMIFGTAPDPAKLQKCTDVCVGSFGKAESSAGGACLSSGDGSAVAADVKSCVDAVVADLEGPIGSGVASDLCQSKKILQAGLYAQCRSKAIAKGLQKGVAPDFTKCVAKIDKVFTDLDERGTCATSGDLAAVKADLEACTDQIADDLTPSAAFRLSTITVSAPTFIIPVSGVPASFWCSLDQRAALAGVIQGFIDGDGNGDTYRDLSLLITEDSNAQIGTTSGTAAAANCLHANPTSCAFTPGGFQPDLTFDHQVFSCTVGSTVIPGGGFGCFATVAQSFPIDFGPLTFTLESAQAGGQYNGRPATALTSGVMRGFLPESTAAATIIDSGTPFVGGQPLTYILRGSQCAAVGLDQRVTGPGGVLGWWVELGYTAQKATLP